MANYPSLPQSPEESSIKIIDGMMIRRASNGSARGRNDYTGKKYDLTIVHYLGNADKQTLETFYDTNRSLTFGFTYAKDGVTRTCIFSPSGNGFMPTPLIGQWWKVTSHMEEV